MKMKKIGKDKLAPDHYYFITLFAIRMDELVKHKIITPTQRREAKEYFHEKSI